MLEMISPQTDRVDGISQKYQIECNISTHKQNGLRAINEWFQKVSESAEFDFFGCRNDNIRR